MHSKLNYFKLSPRFPWESEFVWMKSVHPEQILLIAHNVIIALGSVLLIWFLVKFAVNLQQLSKMVSDWLTTDPPANYKPRKKIAIHYQRS